jgi:lipoprotein-anchoring transpeptidase ErfK/SrfK
MNVTVMAASLSALMAISGVATAQYLPPEPPPGYREPPTQRDPLPAPGVSPPQYQQGAPRLSDVGPNAIPAPPAGQPGGYAALPPEYQPELGKPKDLPPQLRRQFVDYATKEPAGTLIVDTPNTYLYLVLGGGKALRYGIGVGREGFTWTGREHISKMSEWPDWHPPKEMIERQPYLPRWVAGGESNPLGARALYLGNTLYRIHGTNQPSTIGTFVSSGCIRLTNDDVEDLYRRVGVGTEVVVYPGKPSPETADVYPGRPSPEITARLGNLCATPVGAYPGPFNPVGLRCFANTPYGRYIGNIVQR